MPSETVSLPSVLRCTRRPPAPALLEVTMTPFQLLYTDCTDPDAPAVVVSEQEAGFFDCGNGNGPPMPKINPPPPALPTAPPAPAVCAPALPPPAPPAWAPPAAAPPAGAPELPACATAPAAPFDTVPPAPAVLSSDELLPASQAEVTNAQTATVRKGSDLRMLKNTDVFRAGTDARV